MGMSDQRHAPAALPQEEWTTASIGLETAWTSELVWAQGLQEKPCAFPGDRTPVARSLVRHYTELTQLLHKSSDLGSNSLTKLYLRHTTFWDCFIPVILEDF
jgi:hypothetical protein